MPKIKKNSHKRANGTGTVFYDKNKRRHIARMPVKFILDEEGNLHKKAKQIGSFDTEDEAWAALYKARENYDPEVGFIEEKEYTLNDVYEMWLKSDSFLNIKEKTRLNYCCTYKKLSFLYDRPIKSIRFKDIEEFFRLNQDRTGTSNFAKIILSHIFTFAIQRDIIKENPTKLVKISTKKSDKHKFIELEKRQSIWEYCNKILENSPKDTDETKTLRLILIQMFTGLRVNELHRTLLENVHLDEDYIITGSKSTADGRIVPIHPMIKKYVEYVYNHSKDKKHLCEYNYTKSLETNTGIKVNNILRQFDHTSHDFRDTFKTLWLNQNLNEHMVNVIVGHRQKTDMDNIYYKPNAKVLVEENKKLDLFKDS